MKLNFRRPLAAAAIVALLSVSLTACGGDSETSADASNAGVNADGYPVTVDNCGTEVTLEQRPERIVTIKSTSTELALALGAGERIVGTAFADGPVPQQWADVAASVKQIAEKAPTQEVVLEQEPDLVFAGWESNFTADTAGERDQLAKLGVASYVAPSACQGEGYQPKKMTFDLLFEHFAEAGQLLGASEQAAELVEQQRAELAQVGKAKSGTTALWWSSGEETPFVGGTIGAPQMVMDAVGLSNIVDEAVTWTSYGWEAIVDADPDVIVLVDAEWNSAEQKIAALKGNAATAKLSAVKAERFVTVPFPAAEAGVRSVRAAGDIAEQLKMLGFAE